MIFNTRVHGIPCQCYVTSYQEPVPMRVYGSGMGDCDPPEPEEFEFEVLDRKGRSAPWLSKYLTGEDADRLCDEYLLMCKAEQYN